MRRHLIGGGTAICALLAISACSTTSPDTQAVQKSAIGTCQGYDTALKAIKPFVDADKLSLADLDKLDQARAVGRKLCDPTAPIPSDPISAGNQIAAATAALVAITPTGSK
jgi:hypothetical protein